MLVDTKISINTHLGTRDIPCQIKSNVHFILYIPVSQDGKVFDYEGIMSIMSIMFFLSKALNMNSVLAKNLGLRRKQKMIKAENQT